MTPDEIVALFLRSHHLLKTFWTGVGGWADKQLPDGTGIVVGYNSSRKSRQKREMQAINAVAVIYCGPHRG